MSRREAAISRRTNETSVEVRLGLDGSGQASVATGIAFFDHMLTLFAKHGLFDVEVKCAGDLEVDGHHSVEDVGICLGMALEKALGDKQGIGCFAHAYYPMDDTLARVVVDLSGGGHIWYTGSR